MKTTLLLQKSLKLSLLALTLGTAGCFSFETQRIDGRDHNDLSFKIIGGEPVEHVMVSNYGWFLFNAVPIVCGNERTDTKIPWTFFRNDMSEDVLLRKLSHHAHIRGCGMEEVNMFKGEQIFMEIYGIPVPIPYVLCYREMQISAVLVKPRDPAADRDAISRDMRQLLGSLPDGKDGK